MQVANMQVEDKIQFGEYDWRVLAMQDNTALIITYKINDNPYKAADNFFGGKCYS